LQFQKEFYYLIRFKMEVVNPRYSVLTNFEVLQILKNQKDTKKKQGLRNLATITYETLLFLEDSPCKNQTKESIDAFLEDIKRFKFTKNECLMVINDPPVTPLHIQLLIEDSEERLTEEQVNEVLEVVAKHLIPTE